MCIRDRPYTIAEGETLNLSASVMDVDANDTHTFSWDLDGCLLYTSDAADERSSVDLGGRRIIKKKKSDNIEGTG